MHRYIVYTLQLRGTLTQTVQITHYSSPAWPVYQLSVNEVLSSKTGDPSYQWKMVLSGRLALVTGGGRGIGRAVCQILARDNAKVVVTDLNMDSCRETLGSLREDDHFAVTSDVSQASSVNDCFKQVC